MTAVRYAASDVADWFLRRVDRGSGDSITQLKLQKLVYYAQAWHLANFNKPIFREEMEAWKHGPVAPSLWRAYSDQRWNALPVPSGKGVPFDGDLDSFLNAILDTYGKYEAKYLEDLTHKENPWKQTRGDLKPYENCSDPISKKLMRDYYAARIKKAWSGPVISN